MAIVTRDSVFVGLDYHQHKVQVCVLDGEGRVLANESCENVWSTICYVVRRSGAQQVTAAIEACCGAANLAQELFDKAGWQVRLAHPGIVARMKQNPDKTDFSDARLLADLVRVGYLPKVWLAPEETRELRRAVRHRQQLADRRRDIKLRIRALLRDHRIANLEDCRAWTKRWFAWLRKLDRIGDDTRWILDEHLDELEQLNQRIKAAERRLAQRLQGDAVAQKLMSMPGIGLITAAVLRAEVGRFDRFQSGKQLARFCALTPRNASSGDRQADAGLVKAGNRHLRTVLIETAHRLIRCDERWVGFAAGLLARGKKKNVVVAAVANRFVRWLYHRMQPGELAV